MTVVYVDSVFILNGVMDYLLLLVTARLAGIPLRRRRYLLAALAGAAYAVAVFLPGMGFLSAPPVKAPPPWKAAGASQGAMSRFQSRPLTATREKGGQPDTWAASQTCRPSWSNVFR